MKLKIQKLREYLKTNGIKETVKKTYRYICFNVKVKNNTNFNTIYKLSKKEKSQVKLKTKNTIYIFTDKPYYEDSRKFKNI